MESGDITDAIQVSQDTNPTSESLAVQEESETKKTDSKMTESPKITIDTTPFEEIEIEQESESKEKEFVDAYADPKSPMKPLPNSSQGQTVQGFNVVQVSF